MISFLDILSVESWILLLSVCGLARYYLHRRWKYLENLQIPHEPPSIMKMGNFLETFHKLKAFEFDNEQKRKHGPIWGGYAWTSPFITVHDPDILRQVYIKEFHNLPMRQGRLKKIGGKEWNNGLTNVEGDQWKRIRSTMTPTFSTSKLKQMIVIIDRCANSTVTALNRKLHNNGGTFNSKEIFSRLSLDIICSTAFSTDVESQDDSVKEPEVSKQARKIFSGSIFKPMLLMCIFVPYFEQLVEKLGLRVFGGGEAMSFFNSLANQIIERRKQDPHCTSKRVDLMQLMLDAEISEDQLKKGKEKGMTRTEIVGNSLLMILAGYENTANVMSFLAYNLAMHPTIQRDVQREIDEMMKNNGRFDYDGVNSLKLLDMCINETLRLYTPVLRNARICQNEVTISGLNIPKGVQVSIPTYALAHDPEHWDAPYEFRPERMRDMSQIDPMVFQPFGAGPRNCIGMRLALMEIKMSLTKILHHFVIAPAENTPKPPLKLAFSFTVRSAVDYNLRVEPRKKNE